MGYAPMDFKVTRKRKRSMELVTDRDITFFHPLRKKLLADKNVEMVTYEYRHPLAEKPKLYLRVKKDTPKEALIRATRALGREFKKLERSFNEQL